MFQFYSGIVFPRKPSGASNSIFHPLPKIAEGQKLFTLSAITVELKCKKHCGTGSPATSSLLSLGSALLSHFCSLSL